MKRFLVFCCEYREACGGFGDFLQDFDTFEEAKTFLLSYVKVRRWQCGEVVDITKPIEEAIVLEVTTKDR